MRLLVRGKARLVAHVRVDHGVGQRAHQRHQRGRELQQRAVEGPVNLYEGGCGRKVDVQHRCVAKEPLAKLHASHVRGGVARAHELNARQVHERVVDVEVAEVGGDASRPVTTVLNQLPGGGEG